MSEISTKSIDELTFKEASVELEQVVRALESGELELEESLEHYSRGVNLLKSLHARLDEAEQKVQVLVASSEEDAHVDTTSAPATTFIDE